MAIEIVIPRLGWDMTEGVFAGWLKKDGDAVAAGDALFSLETDKATQDVESMDAGKLRIPADAPRPGDRLPVGKVIGHLLAQGDVAAAPEPAAPAAGPAVRRLARELEIDLATVAGSGRAGRITPEDVREHREAGERAPRISPRARRLAAKLSVDWRHLHGSGSTGRIRERDIRAAATVAAPAASIADHLPISATRRTIGERMLRSAQTTAAVTLTTTADATALVRLRNQFKKTGAPVVPSYTDFIAKLVGGALTQHPVLNARLDGDSIVMQSTVNIGIAVDTDVGLLVPVVRDVGSLGLLEVAARSRELIDRARTRRLQATEMQGGTFTITNLGSFGIDAFTPIINAPECAILGLGRIRRVPVVAGKRVRAREQIVLSLSFDHRVLDGAPAAKFLQCVVQHIENPAPSLIR